MGDCIRKKVIFASLVGLLSFGCNQTTKDSNSEYNRTPSISKGIVSHEWGNMEGLEESPISFGFSKTDKKSLYVLEIGSPDGVYTARVCQSEGKSLRELSNEIDVGDKVSFVTDGFSSDGRHYQRFDPSSRLGSIRSTELFH